MILKWWRELDEFVGAKVGTPMERVCCVVEHLGERMHGDEGVGDKLVGILVVGVLAGL